MRENVLKCNRDHQRHGAELHRYLEEKLGSNQLEYYKINHDVQTTAVIVPFFVTEYGFRFSLNRVPRKYWKEVIEPELQRLAKLWGMLFVSTEVAYERRVIMEVDH